MKALALDVLQLWPLAAGAAYRLNQLRYWGIHPNFGFVEEPETNGVVERWNRTLKEQAVYGRVFRNLADVRAAVAEFVERYNQCWRLAARGRTPRCTEIGAGPGWQGATREQIGAFVTEEQRWQPGCSANRMQRGFYHGLLEKLAYRTPSEAREEYELRHAA